MMRVNEIFYSLQGEGFNTGMPAVFIRFSGCNLQCPFCDTNHADGKEIDINKLLSIPKFEYHYDTDKRIRQWKKLLGKEKPFERYVFKEPKQVEVEVLEAYTDLRLGRDLLKTERLFMPYERAKELEAKGLVNLLGENNGEVRDNSGC